MEKTMTQTPVEKQIISEAEIEIRKNVEELVRWLDGSLNYFVRSIKGLAELSKDKDLFRSYVTKRILDNLDRLSEIADIYDKEEEPADEQPSDQSNEGEEKSFTLDGHEINFDDLCKFYKNEILGILAENTETLDNMRLRISMLHVISDDADKFGCSVLEYISHRILLSQTQELPKKIALLLCLMVVIGDHEYEEYGCWSDNIKGLVDNMAITICMAITKDYEKTQNQE